MNIGEHHVTYHNQGLCNYSMNQPQKALEHFKKAMTLNPAYEKARNWHDKVSGDILSLVIFVSTANGTPLTCNVLGNKRAE